MTVVPDFRGEIYYYRMTPGPGIDYMFSLWIFDCFLCRDIVISGSLVTSQKKTSSH